MLIIAGCGRATKRKSKGDGSIPPRRLGLATTDAQATGPSSGPRPHRSLQGTGEDLGPLAADQESGAVGQVEPDAAVAPGVEHPLAITTPADPPPAVVRDRAISDHLEALDGGD